MTFDTIKKFVGKNLKIYSTVSGWSTTVTDINETDIGDIVNVIYRDELFPDLVTQFSSYYRNVGTMDSWIASGTAAVSSTGTTLVSSLAMFTNSMVGLYVYNSTEDESALITGYTNTTTVTLDTTIGNTWDGDSIYVLGQEFTLGGDATDLYEIEAVGLKYTDEAQYFRITGELRPKFDLIQYGDESFNSGNPQAYITTNTVGGVSINAIGVLPAFTQKVTQAIEITYTGKPAAMVSANDVPRIPVDMVLIYGATAWAFRQKEQFKEADIYDTKYFRAKKEFKSKFLNSSKAFNLKPRMPRSFYHMFNRNR